MGASKDTDLGFTASFTYVSKQFDAMGSTEQQFEAALLFGFSTESEMTVIGRVIASVTVLNCRSQVHPY